MYSTGIFKLAKYEINFINYNEPIYLIPFGDIHRHSPLCAVEHWFEFLDWAKKKKNCYFIGMGDYDDLGSSSERILLNHKSLHESTISTLEDLYLTQTLKLSKELSFMKGKIIGLIEGNHYGEFQNGTTTTQKLCELLGCQYLGVSSFVRLQFNKAGRNTSNNIDIWAHHGRGAARTMGGSLNKVEQMAENAEADIFMMGHDHKKSVAFIEKMKLVEGMGGLKLKQRKTLLARSGSFLKGYVDGQKSYVADMALKPCDLGVVKIELTPKHKSVTTDGNRVETHYIDIHASI